MCPDTYMWSLSWSPHVSISYTEPRIGELGHGSFRSMNTKPGLAAGSVWLLFMTPTIRRIRFHLASFCRQGHLWRISRSS
jgi:hypothetical protein